jgi:hypothetical protein
MSISDSYKSGKQAGYYSHHLSDLFRIRPMERLLKQALEELEQVKARLSCIEGETAIHNPNAEKTKKALNTHYSEGASSMPPLPIAEIKQLAEMAKRFR